MGFMQRYEKVKFDELWLDRGISTGGSLFDAKSGIAGFWLCVHKATIQATATANTDIGPISLPAGMSLLRLTAYTTTAFTAGTDAKLQIGTSAGDDTYVAPVSIAAVGTVALTIQSGATVTANCLSMPAPPNLYPRLVQTGTPSAVGAATLCLEFA